MWVGIVLSCCWKRGHSCMPVIVIYLYACLIDKRFWVTNLISDKILGKLLWLSDAIWSHKSGLILDQVMAWCLTAPSHYLNQCWTTREVLWHGFENYCIFQGFSAKQTKLKCIWVRSRNCGHLVTWFCYQLIAKPGNKTATVPWPDAYVFSILHYSIYFLRAFCSTWIPELLPHTAVFL